MNAMNSEALVKGKIAEATVELLLEANGYNVRRISREGILGAISRADILNLNQSDSAGKITTAPSLAVFDKKGKNVILTKIKFRGSIAKGRNISHGVKQLLAYWPEAVLVVVTLDSPTFRVILTSGEERPIEDLFSQITKNSLEEFERIVEKFLKV